MAKRENSPTLYSYVKEYIMKLIISGKYPAHSQLPTEYELMETLDVGRATVRAALAQLENEGTIYKRQGVGTFVSERSKHYGLEPFLSLNFTLKHVGMKNNNEVIENGDYTVTPEDFLDRSSTWSASVNPTTRSLVTRTTITCRRSSISWMPPTSTAPLPTTC